MYHSMAESYFKLGVSDERLVRIILSPDTVLILFIDGSSIVESIRFVTVYESYWL